MNRYLTIHIPETSAPAPVSHFLRTQAGLTKKQISQAKFRPSGVQKNGQQCRVTETAYAGDKITVCLETNNVDSAQLESAPAPQFLPELAILYEDQDILAVNKPAGIVTHPSGSHYSDSLSNQVAAYFRSKGEPTKVRSIGRLDKETSGILLLPGIRLLLPDYRNSGKMEFQRKPIWLRFPVPCQKIQMERFIGSQRPLPQIQRTV